MIQMENVQLRFSPQLSLKQSQAMLLFHLIQQSAVHPSRVLDANSLQSFLKNTLSIQHSHAVTILQKLNTLGVEMNADNFGLCLGLYCQEGAENWSKLQLYNDRLWGLLKGKDQEVSLESHSLMEGKQSMESNEDLAAFYLTVLMFEGERASRFDAMEIGLFRQYLSKVNFCLSSILYEGILQKEIVGRYVTYVQDGLVQRLFHLIGVNTGDRVEIIKCLSYLYEGMKFKEVKAVLEGSQINHEELWLFLIGLLLNVNSDASENDPLQFALVGLL